MKTINLYFKVLLRDKELILIIFPILYLLLATSKFHFICSDGVQYISLGYNLFHFGRVDAESPP